MSRREKYAWGTRNSASAACGVETRLCRRSAHLATVLLALAPAMGALGQAAPQPAPQVTEVEDDPAYRALIAEAIREYALRNYAEARSLFTRAYTTHPNARVMRGLGMAEFELRNYIASTDLLTRALASHDKPLTAEQRAQTIELLQRAQGFIGRFTMELSPPEAAVQVDGAPIHAAAGNALLMQVGDHTLEVSASGYRPTRRIVKVTGGEVAIIRVRLEPVSLKVQPTPPPAAPGPAAEAAPPAPSPTAPEPAREASDGSVWESPWLWAGAGAIVVGVGAVLVVALSGGETITQAPIADDLDATLGAP